MASKERQGATSEQGVHSVSVSASKDRMGRGQINREDSSPKSFSPGEIIRLDEFSYPIKLLSGNADIFAVRIDRNGEWTWREFLFDVGQEDWIWPIQQRKTEQNGDSGVCLIAQFLNNVEARPLPIDPQATMSSDRLKAQSWALETWVQKMSLALGSFCSLPPTEPTWMNGGEELSLSDKGWAAPQKNTVWLDLESGDGDFLGLSEISSKTNGGLLPLTPSTWIMCRGGFIAKTYSHSVAVQNFKLEDSLDTFHHHILNVIQAIFSHKEELEAQRLHKKAKEVDEGRTKTLSKFASLVGQGQVEAKIENIDSKSALLAAFHLIIERLGIELEPTTLEEAVSDSDKSPSPEDLAEVAYIRTRRLALRGEWWKSDSGPLLTYLEEDRRPIALLPNKSVTLLPNKSGVYLAHDTTDGSIISVDDAYASRLAPIAHTFYPTLPTEKVGPLDLLKFGLNRSVEDFVSVLATGFLGGALGMIVPIMTLLIFDSVVPSHEKGQLYQIGLGLVVAALATMTFKIVGDVAFLRIEGRIAGGLQGAVLDRLLRLPNSFFGAYSAGDLAVRTMMIDNVRRSVSSIVVSSLLAVVFSIFSYGLLFYYAPQAAVVATVLFLLLGAVAFSVGYRQLKAIMEGEALSGNIFSLVLQIINGITKLRMAGAEDRAFNLWGENFSELRRRMVESRRIKNQFEVFDSGYAILTLTAIFAAIALMGNEDLTTGAYLAFIAAFTTFLNATKQMARSVISIYSVVPLYKRGQPILETIPEVSHQKRRPGQLSGSLEVNQVTFRYRPDGPRILNGVTLHVGPGEYVAIVGSSGSGKTTLTKLILGFEMPENGGVYYDGQDLRGLDLQSTRRQIGVVLQNGKLMPGSILENIQGASDCTPEDAWRAARQSGIEQDIRDMPMGMHTILTEGTTSLSGGQVQRLLIARALVGQPRILLFDEATSALDNKTQRIVSDSLKKLSVTRIAIAHRLSTVQNADRIYVMDTGRIIEQGTFEELMAKDGEFANFARRQSI